MLLTITSTQASADTLSFLLHKHPSKVQSIEISNGFAHIFYPEVSKDRCTCALLLEIDPIGLVRNNSGISSEGFVLGQYVNDRPYVASSLMSSAISKAFGTAMNGRCKDKPELVDIPMNLEITLSVIHARGGESLIYNLFQPLGYEVTLKHHALDAKFPKWGGGKYFTMTLSGIITLKEMLSHLYVLIPVLDNDKHYWVGNEEMQKLIEKGKGWLENHPQKDLIVRRYLKNLNELSNEALQILMKDDLPVEEIEGVVNEKKVRLHDLRLEAVYHEIINSGAKKVLDMGCGEGKLLRLLIKNKQFEQIFGMDVSWRSLEIAKERLAFNRLSERDLERLKLIHGSLAYRDKRLEGFDTAALVEVIEHLDSTKLSALERVVFEFARPKTVIITTPNKDWNITFTDDNDKMRHSDHRFEWTRLEFETWCNSIKERFGYTFLIKSLGEETFNIGSPSQMAIFKI